MKSVRSVYVVCLAASLAIVAGCGGGDGGGAAPTPSPTPAPPPAPVVTAPGISGQPANQAVQEGRPAVFAVTATGTAPLAYQWRRGGGAILGATAASYTLPTPSLADSGAVFTVVVSNSAGSVTSLPAMLSVVATAAPGPFLEAWTTSDGNPTTGSYALGVVDPAAPGMPSPVDELPASAGGANTVWRVRGGSYHSADATVSEVSTRHLVYTKGGNIYRVTLDRAGGPPAAVQVSTETQVIPGTLQLVAQSLSGDDALFAYARSGTPGTQRFVHLGTPSGASAAIAPAFPGDIFSSGLLIASINDPVTGEITGYLWPSLLASGQTRLFRSDTDFGNPVSIGTFASVDFNLRLGLGGLTGAKMRHGYFFLADGALRRYDFATGALESVYGGVSGKLVGAVFDDSAIYAVLETPSGPVLVKATDQAGAAGSSLLDGGPLGAAGLVIRQTRDYLILITGTAGDTAVSVRKSDGAQTPLPPAAGTLFSWSAIGGLALMDGYGDGNRVFYVTVNPGNVVGSVLADGSDRKETAALATDVGALASSVSAHRLLTSESGGLPMERLMITVGLARHWLDLRTGDVGASLGSLPAGLSPGFGCPKSRYRVCPVGRAAVLGFEQGVPVMPGTSVPRLDAYFVNEQAGSLVRLTNLLP